jgi:NADPH2:quinone reductase
VFFGDFARREPEAFRARMRQLERWYREGRLHPHVSETLPLERAPEALARMASRRVKGKVVIVVSR